MPIRRGRRVADYLDSSCTALFVARDAAMSELSPEDRTAVERHMNFCKNLRIKAGGDREPPFPRRRCSGMGARPWHYARSSSPVTPRTRRNWCTSRCAICR